VTPHARATDRLDATLPAADDAAPAQQTIVLPDAIAQTTRPSPTEVLAGEFGDVVASDVIERTVAAARHALERSHLLATPEAIERLARERLRSRLERKSPFLRRTGGISARPRR